jgi:hypothetical protein
MGQFSVKISAPEGQFSVELNTPWNDGANRRLPQPLAIIEEAVPDRDNCVKFVDFVFVGIAEHDRFRLNSEVLKAAWYDRSEIAALDTTYPVSALAEAVFDNVVWLRAQMGAQSK